MNIPKESVLAPSAAIEQSKQRSAEPEGARLFFHCPGCECDHFFYVVQVDQKPCWTWNGDYIRPTFEPSLLVRGAGTCHSYVRDGSIQFLGDCTHRLANQTVPLPVYSK